ncbi:unnamed protein product [Brassica rapa subsp. narinosa]
MKELRIYRLSRKMKDVKVIELVGDEDWSPPPPNVSSSKNKESGANSTIKSLSGLGQGYYGRQVTRTG